MRGSVIRGSRSRISLRSVEPGCFRVRPVNDWRKSETFDLRCGLRKALTAPLHLRGDRCHIRRMAHGQAVLIITEPLGGGEPQYTLCYVANHSAAPPEHIVPSLPAPTHKTT